MKQHSERFLRLVADARTRVREVGAEAVLARLDAGHEFHLVDVREESEWAAGHLPGALHLGKGILERDVEKRIPDPDAEVVLYCGGGYRSVLAAENLQRMGYRNVLSLAGGFSGWREAGYEVEGC